MKFKLSIWENESIEPLDNELKSTNNGGKETFFIADTARNPRDV